MIPIIMTRRIQIGNQLKNLWLFKCPYCGNEVEKQRTNGLRDKSCGCERLKLQGLNKKTNHRLCMTTLYKKWRQMKQRCFKKYNKAYYNYGARGIIVCNEWLNFLVFREWALSNGYKEGLEIDRIDNHGNYEPNNCRFVTKKENCRNRMNTTSLFKILLIKELLKNINNQSLIGRLVGVKTSLVHSIKHEKTWGDIKC